LGEIRKAQSLLIHIGWSWTCWTMRLSRLVRCERASDPTLGIWAAKVLNSVSSAALHPARMMRQEIIDSRDVERCELKSVAVCQCNLTRPHEQLTSMQLSTVLLLHVGGYAVFAICWSGDYNTGKYDLCITPLLGPGISMCFAESGLFET
jgi:hypothetical protein